MADILYGFDSASVVTDNAGVILAGKQGQVWTAYTGGAKFTATKAIGANLTPGAVTGGIVTTDTMGRPGMFVIDSSDTLWLDFGGPDRWPVNPTKPGDLIQARVDAAALPLTAAVAESGAVAGDALTRADAAYTAALEAQSATRAVKDWNTFAGGYTSHRTGGGQPWAVPGSASAIETAIKSGQAYIDLDLRWNNSGPLWVSHDDDLSLFTTGTGQVTTASNVELTSLRQLAAKTTGGSYRDEPLLTFRDVLERYASRILIAVEPKNQTADDTFLRSLALLDADLKATDTYKAVALTINSSNVANHIAKIRAYPNIRWGCYVNGDQVNNAAFRQLCAANGIGYVHLLTSTTDSELQAWTDLGIPMVVFTDRQSNWNAAKARGFTGLIGDWAVYDANAHQTLRRDPWRNGFWGYGEIPARDHLRPKLQTDGLLFDNYGVTGQQWMLAGDFYPLPATMTFDIAGTAPVAGNPWHGGIHLCSPNDASQALGTAGNRAGYFCYIVAGTGVVNLRRYDNDVATTVGVTTGNTAITTATGWAYRVVVTATSVTVSQRNPTTGALIGTEFTANDTTYRGGYLHVGQQVTAPGATKITSINVT